MSTSLIVFLCLPFLLSEINCFQRFAEQPKYTEVDPGQDALLTCKIIDIGGICSWQKDNKPIGIYPRKYEWAGISSLQGIQLPSIDGDCSLWIRSATLEFDDGFWECQVTASDFTTQDALTSQPVRLVVRVAPQRPRLEYEGIHISPGHNITVENGAIATVKCISHYGNPPALIKWFLGDQEISPIRQQINITEPDNPKTWSASSIAQVLATRDKHGSLLKCVALHEAYVSKFMTIETRLNVKYAPTIRLLGMPESDLEEDKDIIMLRCESDANPPANVVWRKAGRSEIASLHESLLLKPVTRKDAGLYTCQAQNSVGISEQISYQLDVKYPPKILSAGPDRITIVPLFSPAAFECIAEGNPPPTYKWVQRMEHGQKLVERSQHSRLVIDNVTYDYQGEYECHAINFINGQERKTISEPVVLQVVGAPQILHLNPYMNSVTIKKGETASLSLIVCADPRPRHIAWEWGSLRLEAGAGMDRYRVEEITQDSREDCYIASLHINQVDIHDSRPYYLVVENERGTDRLAINLFVEEPMQVNDLIGIVGGCIAAIILLILLYVCIKRNKKCCAKNISDLRPSQADSEKADIKIRSISASGTQDDSVYTTPTSYRHQLIKHESSPEAMKLKTTEKPSRIPTKHQKQHNIKTESNEKFIYTIPLGSGSKELLPSSKRHQRDMFSGDIGIPEITTKVGCVIHTFETLAMLRDKYEEMHGTVEKLPPMTIKTKTYTSLKPSENTTKYIQMKKKFNKNDNPSINSIKTSNVHYNPLSRLNYKTDTQENTPWHKDLHSQMYKVKQSRSDTSIPKETDYRKNIGTVPKKQWKSIDKKITIPKERIFKKRTDTENDEDVINKAFNEIYAEYDDHSDQEIKPNFIKNKQTHRLDSNTQPTHLNAKLKRNSSSLIDLIETTKINNRYNMYSKENDFNHHNEKDYRFQAAHNKFNQPFKKQFYQ